MSGEEIELPREKVEEAEAKKYDPRMIFAGGILVIIFLLLLTHGAFGTFSDAEKLIGVGVIAYIANMLAVRGKKTGMITPQEAVLAAESYVRWEMNRGAIPNGQIMSKAKWNQVRNYYYVLIGVDVFQGRPRSYLAKLDAYTGMGKSMTPKPEGWEIDETKDYKVMLLPEAIYSRFRE